MKLVQLTRDMRPYVSGQDVLLPPDTADRLLSSGEATNPRDRFGNALAEPESLASLPSRADKSRYRTKG